MPLIELHRPPLHLHIAPEVGGSVAAFFSVDVWRGEKRRFDWLRPASDAALAAHDPLGMASFPLLPWCNRLRDGRACFEGRQIQLASQPGVPHALHGLGWRLPWRVEARNVGRARLGLQAKAGEQGWPWAFSAWQDYALDEVGMLCAITLRNDSHQAMPFGLGHHPYFPHEPGTRLAAGVRHMWASDAERLPTHLEQPGWLPALHQGITLTELDLDNNFTGWDHRCRISWPGRSHALLMTAEPPLDYFVLYCPSGVDHFCAEPVSNCTDWLNLPGQPVGGGVLAPGQTAQMRWRLQLVAA